MPELNLEQKGQVTIAKEISCTVLIRAYRMYRHMMRYPHLIGEMRTIFLNALTERGIIDRAGMEREALRMLEEENSPINENNLQEYTGVLIDLYFARNFNDVEIENHINLARKEDRFQHLFRVVNTQGVTSRKIKRALKEFCEIPPGDLFISPGEAEGVRVALLSHFFTDQLGFIGIAKNHITIRDIDEIIDNSYSDPRYAGKIGGKAAGMILAYSILLPRLQERDPELQRYVTLAESYYFNSGIFADFIDYNGLQRFHSHKYKSREAIEEEYKSLAHLFRGASFPPDVVEIFRQFLKKVGEHPLILRSSTMLEDNFGHAFSGKYDSIFIANQGELETRLEEFIWGLKQVLMSIFAPAPILYRRDHNLLDFDERMSVLVQKVVGRRYGDYFFPFIGGVSYSYNVYNWSPRIKREDGLVRLVLGLGTRAVNRVGGDYPRMIPLSHPLLRPEVGADKINKYSQKLVEVLNLKTGELEEISYPDLMKRIALPDLYYAVSINRDGHLSPPMFKGEHLDPDRVCLTFDNLLTKTPFAGLMKKILGKLEKAYGSPVDVEFAWDDDKLYLLQCRTLPLEEELEKIVIPKDIPQEEVLFINNQGVRNSIIKEIEYIVYVDPKAYGRLLSRDEKLAIGQVVSRLNRALEKKRYALFGPGRWDSNDINLGVRVGYGDINRCLILAEISFEEHGSTPEVSYGTHFFNDLVEAQIVPIAIFPDQAGTIFNADFLLQVPNQLASMAPEFAAYASVVHVIHVPACTGGRLLQVYQDGQEQRGVGFFAHRAK
jgi:hypothetical protein